MDLISYTSLSYRVIKTEWMNVNESAVYYFIYE